MASGCSPNGDGGGDLLALHHIDASLEPIDLLPSKGKWEKMKAIDLSYDSQRLAGNFYP